MIRISVDNYRYVMVVNSKLTRSEFLKRCGASKDYAKDMFGRIYDSIFSEAVFVKELYNKNALN